MITTADVREAADVLRPVYDASDGQDGRVSIEVDPRLAHDTATTVAEAKQLWWLVDRREPVHQDPGHPRGPAGDHRDARRRHQRQRHADLLAGALPRGHGRLPGRPGAGQARTATTCPRSPRSPRSSSRRVDTEIDKRLDKLGAKTRAARQGRRRQRPPGLRGLRGGLRPPTLGRRWQRGRRQAAAAAVGLHRREGPGVPGHHVRGRPGRPRRGEHHAGGHPGRRRRPRRADRRHRSAAPTTRRTRCSPTWPRLGISYDDVVQVLEDEGVEKFEASWKELLEAVQGELDKLR